MRNIVTLTFALCLVAATVSAQTNPINTPTTIEEVLVAVRNGLQTDRADVMAKNLTLTSDQAAKFWPMFANYQKEQNAIIDGQLKAVQTFIEGFDELSDAGAIGLITGHLERDEQMVALRRKWMPEFQKTLGAKLAVRAMQIDRRLSLIQQMAIAARIPLTQ